MQTINCLIIEDEPLAAGILQDYIGQIPYLHLVAICTDAVYAYEVLEKQNIDLMFLDIHLPRLKGLAFIRSLVKSPQVIITSAHEEYALQGYELNLVDYLLKPIEFDRFVMAVNKARKQLEALQPSQPLQGQRGYMFFNVGKKRVRLFVDEILYIESVKEYVKIITKQKSLLTKLPLSEAEQMFSGNGFLRVHRSFLVAKDKIEAFSATEIEINGNEIPIGRNYKEEVYRALK